MKILIVAATWMEVKLLVDELEPLSEKSHILKQYQLKGVKIDILIPGIGTTFTTFHLTNSLQIDCYDLVINVGIATALTHELELGEVVQVISDEFADLGIENAEEFLTLFESGFLESNEFPFESGLLKAGGIVLLNLKKVRGITTNKSHGKNSSISEINAKFSAHVESMEGAAVFYVCNWLGVACVQVRAISNFAGVHDSSNWNIPLALENLTNCVLSEINNYQVEVVS